MICLANYVRLHAPEISVEMLDLSAASEAEVESAALLSKSIPYEQLFVGISTTTATYQSALTVAQAFRRRHRNATIIFGGHHASAQADVVLDCHPTLVDVIVRGEGEASLLQLLREYPRFWRVPGISYLDEQGTVRHNAPGLSLTESELDEIAPTLDGGGVRSSPGKFDHVTYVSARGCPLSCSFCSVANQKIRAKSIGAVIRDIRHLVVDLGFSNIAIEDNFFAHSRRRTLDLCLALQLLRRSIEFKWDCQTRVESMANSEILQAMEDAGCEAVYLGVEALNARQLTYLGKTRNPTSYIRTLEESVVPAIVNSRIDCYLNLQLGLPGEYQQDRDETLERLAALGMLANAQGRAITIFPQLHVVYPGTQHFHDAIQQQRFGPATPRVFEEFTRWEARQQPIMTWLGEHFAHGVGGIPEGILLPESLRQGRFEVDSSRVFEITSYLRAMERLPGIVVFRYGAYLAAAQRYQTTSMPINRHGPIPYADTILH